MISSLLFVLEYQQEDLHYCIQVMWFLHEFLTITTVIINTFEHINSISSFLKIIKWRCAVTIVKWNLWFEGKVIQQIKIGKTAVRHFIASLYNNGFSIVTTHGVACNVEKNKRTRNKSIHLRKNNIKIVCRNGFFFSCGNTCIRSFFLGNSFAICAHDFEIKENKFVFSSIFNALFPDSFVVLVLGDIGRSPRMTYHAISLSQYGTVHLIGTNGVFMIVVLTKCRCWR